MLVGSIGSVRNFWFSELDTASALSIKLHGVSVNDLLAGGLKHSFVELLFNVKSFWFRHSDHVPCVCLDDPVGAVDDHPVDRDGDLYGLHLGFGISLADSVDQSGLWLPGRVVVGHSLFERERWLFRLILLGRLLLWGFLCGFPKVDVVVR